MSQHFVRLTGVRDVYLQTIVTRTEKLYADITIDIKDPPAKRSKVVRRAAFLENNLS